jgi:trans-aconitate methyltransferase
MSGFSLSWLSMREPYDRAARNVEVVDAVAATFADASAATVTDLGCGTGATMRAIAPRLPAHQSWRLVDNDQVLLDVARKAAPAGATVTAVVLDLAQAIEQALDSCDLVATSALLDLVSAAWLDRLVACLARLSRPFYAALSYDGMVAMAPARTPCRCAGGD